MGVDGYSSQRLCLLVGGISVTKKLGPYTFSISQTVL